MSDTTREDLEGQEQESDVLNMSDEELSNFNPSSLEPKQPEEPADEGEGSVSVGSDAESDEDGGEDDPDEGQETPSVPRENVYQSEGSDIGPSDDDDDDDDDDSAYDDQSSQTDNSGIDYKAQYETLFTPFKASDRMITVKSIEDARRLMQMGVDYQFKMQALKPSLKIMKALEKNGLLDQDKVNFLIDLDKKNPEAIKKYFKEKEIDPLDLDISSEEGTPYQPQSYAPTDQELALDEVLDEIRTTPTFQRTLKELGDNWDSESKQVLSNRPALIKLINGHIKDGIYDKVMNIVHSERALGRLSGMNDLMAYKTVGDALHAQGAFKQPGQETKPQQKASHDPAVKARKRAASPTKRSTPAKAVDPKFNPLSLSDEDFEKLTLPAIA